MKDEAMMWKRWRRAALVAALMWTGLGCQAPECAQMTRCCAAVKGAEGVGKWCGEFSTQSKDPDTCRVVSETIREMYDKRKKEVPAACQ